MANVCMVCAEKLPCGGGSLSNTFQFKVQIVLPSDHVSQEIVTSQEFQLSL